jgi:16S rRNA (uracil1498-N3)-methyltransferase
MPHIFRFFGSKTGPKTWALDTDEIEHLRKVLKLRVGDVIEVMDGRGIIGEGVLVNISKESALVETNSEISTERPGSKLALAMGALKPGDVDDILTDLVELGMNEIHIFQQSDSAKYRTGDKPRERWQRLIRAAMKQCKSAWQPTIVVHNSLKDVLEELKSFDQKCVLDAAAEKNLLDLATTPIVSMAVIIGSERGLNLEEGVLCEKFGFLPAQMGAHVLRARTAAVAAAAILGTLASRGNAID